MADRKSQRLGKQWKKREEKKKKVEDLRPQMVTISSDVEELSIGADSGGNYSDGSQSTTKTQERYLKYLKGSKEEQKIEELAKANGWCNPDGTPWGYKNMPKDEAALLKQGVVDRSCKRSTYFSFGSPQNEDASPMGYPKFYDEIELLNRGLVDKKGHCHHRRGHQGLVNGGFEKDAIASGPITIAELNSRGILDNNGHIHYGLQSLLKSAVHEASGHLKKKKKAAKTSNSSKKQKERKKKETMKRQEKPAESPFEDFQVGDCRKAKNRPSSRHLSYSPKELSPTETRISFSSIQPPHSSSSSAKATEESVKQKHKILKPAISPGSSAEGTYGTIKCQVGSGRGKDGGTVAYTVTKDGRNYELNTNDGHFCHLEFNKRHAYLILG